MTDLRGVVLDMEGVLHIDWEPLPGLGGGGRELRAAGLELAILTNTTGKTRQDMAVRLGAMGMAFAPERIVTAASATAEQLRRSIRARRSTRWSSGGVSSKIWPGSTWSTIPPRRRGDRPGRARRELDVPSA